MTAVGVSSRKASGLSGCNQRNPGVAEKAPASPLGDQVTGEAVRYLHDNRADAVARNVLEHGGEGRPPVDRIAALHAIVAVLGGQLVARTLGERRDCVTLALECVLLSRG